MNIQNLVSLQNDKNAATVVREEAKAVYEKANSSKHKTQFQFNAAKQDAIDSLLDDEEFDSRLHTFFKPTNRRSAFDREYGHSPVKDHHSKEEAAWLKAGLDLAEAIAKSTRMKCDLLNYYADNPKAQRYIKLDLDIDKLVKRIGLQIGIQAI